jgi:hypothetical protein
LAGVYHSDGTLLARLEWKTWDIYKGLTGPTDSVGTPVILSQKGIEDGLQVFPAIDPAAFTTIKIPYYARIRRPSEASELLMLPETREALIAGGEFMVMRFRYAKFPNIWGSFRDDFERTCEAAIGASKRWLGAAHMAAYPEEAGSLPSGATPLNPGTVYIRI